MGEFAKLIPQLTFDLIGRIAPGMYLMAMWYWTLPNHMTEKFRAMANGFASGFPIAEWVSSMALTSRHRGAIG